MRITVLDGYAVNPGDLSWAPLEAVGETKIFDYDDPDDAERRCAGTQAVFVNRAPLSGALLSRLSELRFIGTLGTGYNMVDLACCRERGITVCNVPGYSTMSVAQHTFALLLALTNRVESADRAAREGFWTGLPAENPLAHYAQGLEGKTFGIIGFGTIGRAVARIALAFGMRVVATSRTHTAGSRDGVTFLPLGELLETADIVTLHCPLTDETRGLIGEKALGMMRPGALLLNTARGPIVDEEALRTALDSGRLSGAAVDVLTGEPGFSGPLKGAKNCLVTPHIAWTAEGPRRTLIDVSAANLRTFLAGKPQNRVV